MNFPETTETVATSGDSLQALLTWLQQNPKTLGWDAVVVYNRGRANALLMQQYINNLTAENYLTPIDGQIQGAEGSKLNFFGIQLGLPRLSFENADIEHSRARVTQAITAGLAIMKSEPAGGYKTVHSIMRPTGAAGPSLWMDLDLRNASGNTSEAGKVLLDLKNMTGFGTDLFSDQASITHAQAFFLERFRENPELQIYTLGALDKSADSALAPQNFVVLTQPAQGAHIRSAPNYGDGAVIMLVTLKNGVDGGTPTKNSDFRYLIPNDENGTKYSSAVLLSNKIMFRRLLYDYLVSALPGITPEVKIPVDQHGNHGHSYLRYATGGFFPRGYRYSAPGINTRPNVVTAGVLDSSLSTGDVTISASNDGIRFCWVDINYTLRISYTESILTMPPPPARNWNSRLDYEFRINADSRPLVNSTNSAIEFENYDFALQQIAVSSEHRPFADQQRFEDFCRRFVLDQLMRVGRIRLPAINVFLLKNLLFPNNNGMVLTDAFVPGDLAVFGNVKPSRTSFIIEPENPVLPPGSTRTFSVEPAANVTWRARGLPGNHRPVGTIDLHGVYAAPTLGELQGHDAQQVIITASRVTLSGIVSSSTLVSIVGQGVSVNPAFSVVGKGEQLRFTAGTVEESPLQWTLKEPAQGGSVTPATGREVTYTAPANGTGMFTLETLQVTDDQGNSGQASVLVINKPLGGQVDVDLAGGKAQLWFKKDYGSGLVPMPPEKLQWALLAGPGSVDATGLYTEPQQQLPGFCVITCAFTREPDFEGAPIPIDYGYTVLPLPLSQYPDVARAYR